MENQKNLFYITSIHAILEKMDNQKKCFLICNSGIDISSINSILRDNSINVIDQFDFSPNNHDFNFSIREKVKSCNFSLAIINEFTTNISYEIGVSIGLNKSILMILINDSVKIPPDMNSFQFIRCPINDIELLKFSINEFLTNLQKGKNKINTKKIKTVENTEELQNKISQIERIRTEGNSRELENFIENFFTNELAIDKIQISTEKQDRGIDFVLWNYDPSNNFTKPIPVQIKMGNLSINTIKNAENQLIKSINLYEGNFGCLFYLDKEGKRFKQNFSLNPIIIQMDIRDFIEKIRGKNFWSFILEQRNKIAHMRD